MSCAAPPIRRIEIERSVAIHELRPGLSVYEFGKNASHLPRIGVRGPAGASVRLVPAELLSGDGTADQRSTGSPIFCTYTVDGTGLETSSPRFLHSGFSYLQVEAIPATAGGERPALEKVESAVVHSTSPPAGTFETSSATLNQIYALVRWAQRSNMTSVLTDCPHREKLGWLEQTHLNGPALRYNFDLNAFFAKTLNDMADSQLPDGMMPSIAPEYPVFSGGFRDSPEWSSALLLAAWQQYEFTGDLTILQRHYAGMKQYVEYLRTRAEGGIVAYGLGD